MNWTRLRLVLSDLAAGAVLGALGFITARTLGLPHVVHLYGYELFWPSVILGAVLYASPLRPIVLGAATGLVLLLAVVAYTPLIVRPAHSYVRTDPVGPVDAVIVLASGVNDDGLVSPYSTDRLLRAIEVAGNPRLTGGAADAGGPGRLPIVATVVQQGRAPRRTSIEDQRRILSLAGEGVDVRFTDTVRNTREEARVAAAMLRSQGWRRLAVVTSPMHTRRACRTFERLGVEVVCVAAPAREFAVTALRQPADRVRAFQLWLYETAAAVYYRVRGWA